MIGARAAVRGSLGSVGMTGTEAVGGQLYLTNLRLIFPGAARQPSAARLRRFPLS